MPDPMTPEEVRQLRFKSVFRGFDPAQVSAQLNRIAEAMETIISERDELLATPPPDPLKEEIDAVRHEVGEILDTAREVAAAMRSRAKGDASEIVKKAEVEAVRIRSESTSEPRPSPRHMADLEELEVSGEPSPSPEAESPETAKPLLGKPLYPPDAPPGGWGAPAVRVIGRDYRDQDGPDVAEDAPVPDPVDEETSEDALQADADLPSETAEFIPETTDAEEDWDSVLDGATDLAAAQEQQSEDVQADTAEDAVVEEDDEEEVAVEAEPAAEPPTDAEEQAEEEEESEEEAEADAIPELTTTGERKKRIGSLFASLRGEEPEEAEDAEEPEGVEQVEGAEDTEDDAAEEVEEAEDIEEAAAAAIAEQQNVVYPLPEHVPTDEDEELAETEPIAGLLGEPFGMRESLVLPVTNRCLRGLKRQLADIQEDIVELAVEAEWEPDRGDLAEEVRAVLKVLVAEAFAAGHSAVEEWTGESIARPQITDRDPSTRFVAGLADEIENSLVGVNGERGRSSAVSRVLRAWRTDEAERRVRSLGHEAFHRGVLASVVSIEGHQPRWVVAGSGCITCRAKQETIPVTSPLPPVHAACECVIGVATVTEA